jgi:imidazolonepropionase-like amidohydrolase
LIHPRPSLVALVFAITMMGFAPRALKAEEAPAPSGTFVLHKFAKAIGKETYEIRSGKDDVTLNSHFLFTDRGSPVPLDTTFAIGPSSSILHLTAKGQVSRQSKIDLDLMSNEDNQLGIALDGKTTTVTVKEPWFPMAGYAPVAMQEQMMRWWLSKEPASFTVYPSGATVRIVPAGDITVEGHKLHGYTVSGLIWGQECLWMDDAKNLAALVSTDAEFDHFEATRDTYAKDLNMFIAEGVKNSLAALAKISASTRLPAPKLLAIVGATMEDSSGAITKDSVILMANGVITAAGSRLGVKVPMGATVIDAAGKYAIPGLWDMHAHYEQVEWGPIYLASGVTSVRDVGNEFDFIRTLHSELDKKKDAAIGPHQEFAGIIDGDANGGKISLGAVVASTPEEARAWVTKYKAAGAKQIKIYSSVTPEIVKAICEAAHAQGMTVTGHIPEGMTAEEGIADGMDQINHISYDLPYFSHPVMGGDGKPDRTKAPVWDGDSERAKHYLATLKEHHTVLDPTMALYETFLNPMPLAEFEPGITHVAPQLRAALEQAPPTGERAARMAAQWAITLKTLRDLHEAGVPIVAGTDQAIPGYSLHRELEVYVQAGFTPLEALQSATIVAARAAGVEKESGSLEVGKRGDVLLLDADPLADIHNTRKVWRTVAAGAVYTPGPLWESVGFLP